MITATLSDLRQYGTDFATYNRICRVLQGNDYTEADSTRESYIRFKYTAPIPILTILEIAGFKAALAAFAASNASHCDRLMFCAWCARQVSPCAASQVCDEAIDAIEAFAVGGMSFKKLSEIIGKAQPDILSAIRKTPCGCARAAVLAASWGVALSTVNAALNAGASESAIRDAFVAMCNGAASWTTTCNL